MTTAIKYFIAIVFISVPLLSFSQHYKAGDSPIVDSMQFLKPKFVLHYNDEVVTFTKVDSFIFKQTPVQEIDSYDKSFLTKRKDSLVIIMKNKQYAFIDDSTTDKRHYGLVQYDGFLKKLKIHLVKVIGWTSSVYYGVHEDGALDTLWFAGVSPTESNTKLIGFQFQPGDFFQVCADTFNTDKNKFEELWDFSFKPEKLYAFKWINENEFFCVISEHHKRKYYYKVSFRSE